MKHQTFKARVNREVFEEFTQSLENAANEDRSTTRHPLMTLKLTTPKGGSIQLLELELSLSNEKDQTPFATLYLSQNDFSPRTGKIGIF